MNNTAEQKIYLWWQPAQHSGRFIVGELIQEAGDSYVFQYINNNDLAQAKDLGFEGYPAFSDFNKVYKENVLDSFSVRLPSRSRDDFKQLLEYWEITDESVSDFDLLSITGGKLQTDHFGFMNLHQGEDSADFLTELAGVHHYVDKKRFNALQLNKGDDIELRVEPDNEYDPKAVAVFYEGNRVGYIRKGQSETIASAVSSGKNVKAFVSNYNVNGVINSVLIRINIS